MKRGGEDAGGGSARAVADAGAASDRRPPRRGVGRSILLPLAVFVALAVVVSVIGWVIYERRSDDMKNESAEGLQAVRTVQSDQIERWFRDEHHDAALLAGDPGIAESLEHFVASGAAGALPRRVRDELDLFRHSHDIASIVVLDTSLRTVTASPSRAGAVVPHERSLAAAALRTGKTRFMDVYRGSDGEAVMELVSPLVDPARPGSQGAGVLVLRLRAEDVLFPLLNEWPASSRSGESVLVAVRGDRVVSVNPLPVGGLGPLGFSRPADSPDLLAAQAVRGVTGIVEGVDYRGEPVLAAVGRIPGTPWYLVAKQDLAVIDEPIRERALGTLAWVLGLIVLAGVVIILYWRSRETRSLRDLVGAERERRRVEVRYAALMREAKEIVLLLDAGNDVIEANDYAVDAYGYSRDELIAGGTGLFRVPQEDLTVADRTSRLEAEGGHLTYESVHRRRDGVQFPVEVSLSVVEVEGEKCYLAIVRDVGERKAAEAALRDSEARYRTLFENSLSGFSLHEMVLDADGRPIDYVTLAANPAFEKQTGLAVADILGRRATDVVPGLRKTGLIERYGRVAATGVPDRFESYVPSIGRRFDIQAVSPRPGQFATVFIDVTERREAEEILSGFFGSSPVGLFILDRDLRCVRVNETLAALAAPGGRDRTGQTVREILPTFADLLEPSLTHVLDTGEALHGVETGGPTAGPGGTPRHALVSLFPITDPDGRVEFVGGVLVDVTPAKRAEQELEASRAFLERVLGVTPEVIYIFDLVEQRTVFSNQEMVDLLGYTPEEILAMGSEVMPRILHPDDRETVADHHRKARELADGEVLEVEYRMRRTDGEWLVLHGRDAVFARDEDGAATQLIGTAQDVTERRRAEAGVTRLSQRLEAMVKASPIAVVLLDTDHIVRLWNPAATAVLGWTAEEALGRAVPFIPQETEPAPAEWRRRLSTGEQFAGLDQPCVRKDGTRISTSMSLAGLRDAEGEYEGVLMLIEDVTERQANVVRLARLTRLYRVLSAVAEATADERDPGRLYEEVCRIVVEEGGFRVAWIGRRRRDGQVEIVASAGAGIDPEPLSIDLRLPAAQLTTVGIALAEGRCDVCPDVTADPRMAPFAAAAAAVGVHSSAAVPIVVDGRHDTALAIYSSETGGFDSEEVRLLERLAGNLGFAIEAAGRERARRRAERQLEKLNASLERRVRERTNELEATNAELEAFSYSVSHDLRAPLRALDGFSLALLEDYGDRLDGEAADYLARIRAASQRMARLIDDLLMLSRVTRRGMTWEEVDLSELARAIAADLTHDDPDRQVDLTVAENMVVAGDAHLLEAALRNLLDNAWKFTSRTGEARIDVGVEDGGEERVFFVRDNGAGFDAQYADKLFAPFQRLHGDDEFPGTGIGLATVQRIVRRHGGRVWADGETGKGTTVRFTLGHGGEGE